MKGIGFLSFALAAALTTACTANDRTEGPDAAASRDAVGTTGEAGRDTATEADKNFVRDLAIAGMAEVELGRMADKQAASADVKRFAAMMVQDHTKAGNDLKQVAERRNIALPGELDEKHMDTRNRLSKMTGAQFDREYMNAMVEGHEDVVDKLESRVDTPGLLGDDKAGKDAAPKPEASDNAATEGVNEWAAYVLPTVRHHLEEARKIQDRLQNRRNTTD